MNAHQESSFTNKHGLKIYTQTWLPKEHKANVIIAHGLGEHSTRYSHVADFMTEKGFAVFALDHQGHGKSEGKRGHVPDFMDFVDDIEQLRRETEKEQSGKPTVLYGHSMGGLISFLYLLKHQNNIDAAILSAPPVGIKMPPPPWQKKLLGLLETIAPSVTLNNNIDAAWLSHDQEVVQAYRDDPLVHPKISVSLFQGMAKGGRRCLEESKKIIKPVLFVIGGEDKIIDYDAGHAAFENIQNDQKKEIVFAGDYHEVHNELDKQKLFDAIWEWSNDLFR